MKRDFVESLGIDKELVDKIMKEHGKTVQALQAEVPEDYTDLKEQVQSHDQIVQDLKEELETAKEVGTNLDTKEQELLSKIAKYESNELKVKVARENNIPYELANKLTGETEEDLIADAKTFASFVNKKDILPLKTESSDKEGIFETMVEELQQ